MSINSTHPSIHPTNHAKLDKSRQLFCPCVYQKYIRTAAATVHVQIQQYYQHELHTIARVLPASKNVTRNDHIHNRISDLLEQFVNTIRNGLTLGLGEASTHTSLYYSSGVQKFLCVWSMAVSSHPIPSTTTTYCTCNVLSRGAYEYPSRQGPISLLAVMQPTSTVLRKISSFLVPRLLNRPVYHGSTSRHWIGD